MYKEQLQPTIFQHQLGIKYGAYRLQAVIL